MKLTKVTSIVLALTILSSSAGTLPCLAGTPQSNTSALQRVGETIKNNKTKIAVASGIALGTVGLCSRIFRNSITSQDVRDKYLIINNSTQPFHDDSWFKKFGGTQLDITTYKDIVKMIII